MGNWTMKKDRELIRLARSKLKREQIALKLNTSPLVLQKAARRLGVNLGRFVRRPVGRPKMKVK